MEGDEGAESTTPPTDDDVLREQSFKRPQGLNLDSFMVATPSSDEVATDEATPDDDFSPEQRTENAGPLQEPLDAGHPHGAAEHQEGANTSRQTANKDAAVGEVNALFTMEVSREHPLDSTTQMAVHGEQTIGKGLAVAMVVVWTAIGALVGTGAPSAAGRIGTVRHGHGRALAG